MRYCQETVIIQSAFLLSGKTTSLEQNLKKRELAPVVRIVKDAINEVSEGLSINQEKKPVLPIETRALHRKLHLWLYKTWRGYCTSSDVITGSDSYLDGFPPLPRFGAELYVSIVQEMSWEVLLIECLTNTPVDVLPFIVQDITSVVTNQPCTKDSAFFTLLFGSLVALESKSDSHGCTSSIQVLLNGFSSLCEHILDKNVQVALLKTSIEFVFHRCFVQGLTQHPTVCQNIKESKKHQDISEDKTCMLGPVCQSVDTYSITKDINKPSVDNGLTNKDSQVMYSLEILRKLFTEHWKETCHWSVKSENNVGQMDCALWHPMHQWILKLYAALGFIVKSTKASTLQNTKLCSFYFGLSGYVETFAAASEHQWILNLQKGLMSDWSGLNILEEERIERSVHSKTFMFTYGSLKEQFDDAVWRVNHNLEGSEDCLNWLLTTEELFDNTVWLECIKVNAIKIGCKEQAVMMVDILCVQRQMIESVPEHSCNCFNAIKELIINIFNDLPTMDQEEIIKYTFSLSLLSAIDVTCDSMFFHPIQCEEDKKKLQDKLQVVFNKLVDSSLASAFRRDVRDIKQMALLSPYITLYRALQAGVQYGQTHTIIKILQELPILCSLCTSDTGTPILCEILVLMAAGLQNKQQEKNLIKLVKMLLQQHKHVDLPGMSQPLLDINNLVTSCVLPYMNLHDNKNHISTQLALKLLKSSLTTFDVKNQSARAFVLRYLIPITLGLCRLLDGCKVHWEDMVPNISLPDVAELRTLILDNLKESINVIHSVFQGETAGLIHPVEWLNNKMKSLDWTTALHVKPLLDILAFQHQCYIPKCVIEFCDLPTEHWSACDNKPYYNAVDGLFECCAVSDVISCQIIDALKKTNLQSKDEHFKDHVIRNLGKVMTYFTWSEMSRVLSLCKILIQNGVLRLESFTHHSKIPMLSLVGIPGSLNAILVLSSVLHRVFKLLLRPGSSFLTSFIILANVIKLYVSTIKELCKELVTDPGLDKSSSGDVIARVFDDLSHVICTVPVEVRDPLFILALDVAAMTKTNTLVADLLYRVQIDIFGTSYRVPIDIIGTSYRVQIDIIGTSCEREPSKKMLLISLNQIERQHAARVTAKAR